MSRKELLLQQQKRRQTTREDHHHLMMMRGRRLTDERRRNEEGRTSGESSKKNAQRVCNKIDIMKNAVQNIRPLFAFFFPKSEMMRGKKKCWSLLLLCLRLSYITRVLKP